MSSKSPPIPSPSLATAAAATASSLEPTRSPPDQVTSFPLAAQIPLKDFNLPDFPTEALHLRELTLTADIKMDEYQSLVTFEDGTADSQSRITNVDANEKEIGGMASLPQSLTHLTLELFSLGFPGHRKFLTSLAKALPNLKSLTLFSCLIDGLDDESRRDAEGFFQNLPLLREVHFIDSFARPGFFLIVGKLLEERARETEGDALKAVEVSYTYRGHEDEDFLGRVGGEELVGLVCRGLVGGSFGFVPAAIGEKGLEENGADGPGVMARGVLPFASDSRASYGVKKRFEGMSSKGELADLRVLNLSMWTLRAREIGEVLYACASGREGKLVDLTVSVLMEDGWWDELVSACAYKDVAKALEGIEIVGVPADGKVEGEDWKGGQGMITKKGDVEKLGKACPSLARFEMSVLRASAAGIATWSKDAAGWKSQ